MILLQRYDRKSSCFQLRLCNKKLANLCFTVDISKSVNLDPASWGGLQFAHNDLLAVFITGVVLLIPVPHINIPRPTPQHKL